MGHPHPSMPFASMHFASVMFIRVFIFIHVLCALFDPTLFHFESDCLAEGRTGCHFRFRRSLRSLHNAHHARPNRCFPPKKKNLLEWVWQIFKRKYSSTSNLFRVFSSTKRETSTYDLSSKHPSLNALNIFDWFQFEFYLIFFHSFFIFRNTRHLTSISIQIFMFTEWFQTHQVLENSCNATRHCSQSIGMKCCVSQ